jgi:TonB family protein
MRRLAASLCLLILSSSATVTSVAQTGLIGTSEKPMYVCTPTRGQPCAEPPRQVYSPDPDYPEEAQKEGLPGTVVLWTIITKEGKASNIRVRTAAGHGFDEAAIAALSRWKFDPATYEGKPVAVQINVAINFKP